MKRSIEPALLAFASGKPLYPVGEGGGETIAHDLLAGLAGAGFRVEAFGSIEPEKVPMLVAALTSLGTALHGETVWHGIVNGSGKRIRYPAGGIFRYHMEYPTTLASGPVFLDHFERRLRESAFPVSLLQAEMSPQLFEIARRNGSFPIVYLQNGLELKLFRNPGELPLVLANSKFFVDRLRKRHGVRCELLYPAVHLDRYVAAENSHDYITMINPVIVKGVVPFLKTALAMPDRRFLAVEGWGTPPQILEAIQRVPNVTYMRKQVDMRAVYGSTHILMVPSQWDEAFGRVITEAQANGIPVVASQRGGIPEALGDGGVLVKDVENPQAWAHALLEAEARYGELSERAKENARRFSVENAVSCFLEILNSLQGGLSPPVGTSRLPKDGSACGPASE